MIIGAISACVPAIQLVKEAGNNLNNLSAAWTDKETGFTRTYGVRFGTYHNDEELAYERGNRQPDGSYVYTSNLNRVHVCPAAKVAAYEQACQQRGANDAARAARQQYVQEAHIDVEATAT